MPDFHGFFARSGAWVSLCARWSSAMRGQVGRNHVGLVSPIGTTAMVYLGVVILSSLCTAAGVRANRPECACAANRISNGWCESCNVGYVASTRIKSAEFFHAIDAHGHETRADSLRCKTCRIEIKSDGFCKKCKTGYINQKAYFSRLTYLLARGRVKVPGSVACRQCRNHVEHPSWCETCKTGTIGHVAFKDRNTFLEASQAHDVMLKAIRHLQKCETCAIAMAVDRKCYRCNKSYERGKLVERATPED